MFTIDSMQKPSVSHYCSFFSFHVAPKTKTQSSSKVKAHGIKKSYSTVTD